MRCWFLLVLLTVGLWPASAVGQTCEQRFNDERALLAALPNASTNLTATRTALLASHDALRAANCILGLPAIELHAAPLSVIAGQAVTATWANVTGAAARDWIGLYLASNTGDQQFLAWAYTSSCTQVPGLPKASGQCAVTIAATAAAGTYNLRLFRDDGFQKVATSEAVTVTLAPVIPQTSPSGTRVPRDGPQIVDATKAVFTFGDPVPWAPTSGGRLVLRNGASTGGGGLVLLFWNGKVYVEGEDPQPDWYQYIDGQAWPWLYVGTVAPDAPTAPPTLPPGLLRPALAAPHDGLAVPPFALFYRLIIDGRRVLEVPASAAWFQGEAYLTIPKTLECCDHVLQMAAVFICPAGASCWKQEIEAVSPPLLYTAP